MAGEMILCRNRFVVSRGFIMLLALLLWLDMGFDILLPALLACLLHECGHITAIKAVGGSVKQIHLTMIGAEIILDEGRILSYQKEALVAIAGPVTSLLCALLAAKFGFFLFAGMCLGQGVFNLLPAFPLDGGKTLCLVLSSVLGPDRAESILTVFSALTIGLLLGLALLVLKWFGNLTLAFTVVWLLSGLLKKDGTREKYKIKKKIMLAK